MKVTSVSYIFLIALFVTISSCSTVPKSPIPELQTVAFVDMDRYLGKWYEIARYPHSFEEECYGATAFYKKKKDGSIKVINQCRLGSIQGKLKEAIGEDAVFVAPGAESVLPLVLSLCERRSRFSDKLVDLATGRFTEHDFEHWGRLWHYRLGEIANKTGERRAEIEPLLAGRPSDLSKEAADLALPPQPAELEYVGSRDFRTVQFGGYELVTGSVAEGLDLHLTARILRTTYGANLSLVWSEGTDMLILSGDESGGPRSLDCVGMVEQLVEKLNGVVALTSEDHVARFRVAGFEGEAEHLDDVLAEIAMGRSVLEG